MSNSSRRIAAPALAALALACSEAFAATIEPTLAREAAAGGPVDVLLVLRDQGRPVLAPLAPEAGYLQRRRALVDALRARAKARQAALRDWLAARGIAHRPYWIVDAIQARVTPAQLADLAARDDLARIDPNRIASAGLPPAIPAAARPPAPAATTWGLERIGAPQVWAEGIVGQGVVIGGEDTGYQWDHPALKAGYRGWDGAMADHAYNWHDAIHDAPSSNPCGNDSPEPCDDSGHGTHTAGTFAGSGVDPAIGVAPGARWVGCRNMADGFGTPARYIECMQWMLAPTDADGSDPNPDLAPDVVSNSWTCIESEGCAVGDEIRDAVDTLVDAGIFYVAAAANAGPECSTIDWAPAIYDSSFVAGATDEGDAVAGFSSRGPVAGATAVRPDLAAPGVDVYSSVPGGYAYYNGTSMATPHIAGAAALLMSADPSLKGHPRRVADLLRASATTTGISDPWNSGCGGRTMADWPNYQAGYGRLDVYAAYLRLRADGPILVDGFDGPGAR
jgi:subtilisin family serine protease